MDIMTSHAPARPREARVLPQPPMRTEGLLLLVGLAALAFALSRVVTVVSPLVAGVAVGALVVNVLPPSPHQLRAIEAGSRRLLRIGIVLLGLRLSLGDLAELGARGVVAVGVVVTATFFGTRWLGRLLGIGDDLALLVATGYSICGASAIAAMDGVVRAKEEETAYAITLVTLCGTLSIFVLPFLAAPLGLEGSAFGAWVGSSVHDVGQVVATASRGTAGALAVATVVKLTRVVLLAPIVAGAAISRRRADDVRVAEQPPVLPLFVVGFIGAIALRSTNLLPAGALSGADVVEKLVLTTALVGLGMGVRLDRMRRLGGRPLVLGLLAWVVVAGFGWAATSVLY
jgi:uncharacterized integral membrane protein (TIGR00698 family)